MVFKNLAAYACIGTNTYGVRYTADREVGDIPIGYAVEFAKQTDAGSNPFTSLDENYINFELDATFGDITAGIQYEKLGGSASATGGQFITPFADVHVHNGMADYFVAGVASAPLAPGAATAGLQDLNVWVSGEVQGIGYHVAFHMFDADATYATFFGTADEFGQELDVVLTYPLDDNTNVGIKFTDFNGYNVNPDVSRFMAWLDYNIL